MFQYDADKPIYSIGTAARMVGVSVHTLRMYEKEGLIIAVKSEGNQRLYSLDDINRLLCIRKAITEDKLSIEGIKRVQALIPCWTIKKCPEEQRNLCPAFRQHTTGCWTINHLNNICAGGDCKKCEVYSIAFDCNRIKTRIADTYHPDYSQVKKNSSL